MLGVWSSIKRVGAIEVGRPRGDLSRRGAGLLVTLLVAFSTVAYGLTTGAVKNIWILPDELTYGLLARSFATTGHFAIRGVDTLAYPIGYPFLIAAGFVGRSPVAGYEAAKWINSLLMSLAAVPTYLIARRLLTRWLSLLAAGLTLVIPSYAYTGVLMSENAFFPLVLLALLLLVRALEQPSAGRQLAALVSIIAAVAARAEGLVLIAVLVGSMVLVAASNAERGSGYVRRATSELWRFRLTWIVLPLSVLVLLGGEAALGKSPGAVLGRYSGSLGAYPVGPTLRWAVYQLIDLQFFLVALPLVPAGMAAVALHRRPSVPRSARAVASVSACATVLFVLAAAAASQGSQGGGFGYPNLPPELHDRYCFFVAPLILILFLYWVEHRSEFSNRILIPLLVGAAALPLVLPYSKVHSNAAFDALALLPWHNSLIAERNVHFAMAATAALLGALLLSRRRSVAILQIALVAIGLWFVGEVARYNIADASVAVPTSHPHQRSWIDAAVPDGARVAVLWTAQPRSSLAKTIPREQALWRAEFLNPSVARFLYLGRRMHYDLPESAARLAKGRLALSNGDSDTYRYVLVASPTRITGTVIARDRRAGLTLYRIDSPVEG
jgi:hypothetical protein